MRTFSELQHAMLAELGDVLSRVPDDSYRQFCDDIIVARRIACFGLGREGLALRAFCMRLAHLGFDAHMAGDVTALPVREGDLLIVTSGPGNLTLTGAMIELGQRAGARVLVVTAQRDAADPQAADRAVVIPAQTMADDRGSASVLAMGTAFEIAMGMFFDLAVIRIQELTGQTHDQLRERHFNLE
jgi:6-phospho-3-hexuloisomerase